MLAPICWHPYVSIDENIPKYIERTMSFVTQCLILANIPVTLANLVDIELI